MEDWLAPQVWALWQCRYIFFSNLLEVIFRWQFEM
jgi:hypothetical protein